MRMSARAAPFSQTSNQNNREEREETQAFKTDCRGDAGICSAPNGVHCFGRGQPCVRRQGARDSCGRCAGCGGQGVTLIFQRGEDVLPSGALLATGDEVRMQDGGTVYTVIVRGDLPGTGKPGISQLAALAAGMRHPDTLNGIQLSAADLDDSGTVGLADLVLTATYMVNLDADGPVYPDLPNREQAAREFTVMLEQGPVTIAVSEYSGFGKVGALGMSLTASNERITTKPGDIVLYNSSIVLF